MGRCKAMDPRPHSTTADSVRGTSNMYHEQWNIYYKRVQAEMVRSYFWPTCSPKPIVVVVMPRIVDGVLHVYSHPGLDGSILQAFSSATHLPYAQT